MSDESKFKPGDVVQLRSGGPLMTVASAEATVVCQWYSEGPSYGPDGTYHATAAYVQQPFAPAVLVRRPPYDRESVEYTRLDSNQKPSVP